MGTGYTRKDTADNISDGNIINADDLDLEFNGVQAAFDSSTGHTHDGTDGEGAPIQQVGPNQEIVVTTTVVRPASNNTMDLGVATTNEFKNLYIDGTAYLDSVDIDGGTVNDLTELTVDNISLNGNTITSTNTDGDLNLRANGTGVVTLNNTDLTVGDNDKLIFGDGEDLKIYHDASDSYIDDVGSGSLRIRSDSTIVLEGTDGTNGILVDTDGEVQLYYNGATKLQTLVDGVLVTGDLSASADIVGGNDLYLTTDSSRVVFGADGEVVLQHMSDAGLRIANTNTTDDSFPVLTLQSNQDTITAAEDIGRINFNTVTAGGGVGDGTQARINIDATGTHSATTAGSRMEFFTTTASGTLTRSLYIDEAQNVGLADNQKLKFGNSTDLQIYHDGSHSYIDDQGTGNLKIRSGGDSIRLESVGGDRMLVAINDAEVRLYYDDVEKLSTSSTGVEITGTITSDKIGIGTTSPTEELEVHSTGDTKILVKTSGTGDADATLQLDSAASGESIVEFLHDGVLGAGLQWFTDGGPDLNIFTTTESGGQIDFQPNESLAMRITAGGDVGIGTDSPSTALDVAGTITSDKLTVDGSGTAIDLRSNNHFGPALNTLRFTDTDGSASAGQEMGKIEFYSSDASTPGAGVKAEIVGASEVGNPGSRLEFKTDLLTGTPIERMRIDRFGDISFYEDTGTTPKFFWDASEERLKLTTSNSGGLVLDRGHTGNQIRFDNAGTVLGYIGYVDGTGFSISSSSGTANVTVDTNGNFGVGTSSPATKMHVKSGNFDTVATFESGDRYGTLRLKDSTSTASTGGVTFGVDGDELYVQTGSTNSTALRIDDSGQVGIGTSSPDAALHVDGTDTTLLITEDSEGTATLRLGDTQGNLSQSFAIEYDTGSEVANFVLDGTHRARFTTGGDYVVGPTTATTPFTIYNANNDSTKAGVGLRYTGYVAAARYDDFVMQLNRMNSSGDILGFRKDGSTVGSIGSNAGAHLTMGSGDTGLLFNAATDKIHPWNMTTQGIRDNAVDLGVSVSRFDDIYATNGTIQTSDRNEKQDIEVLSDAETRVAQACKGLLRKFRWQDAVAEKGDDARIHFGIIAQDLQNAFTDEGLDAGRYAMFISSTWWETQTEVPAVEAVEAADATYDENGNELTPDVEAVEAKEAYTRTDTYETQEEAPDGATERTRLGVRYPELLAFIIAAI